MKTDTTPLVYGIDDLCKALDVGKNTAYELLSNGEIHSFKIGSCWKIPVKSVEDYIARKCLERNTDGKKELCTLINKSVL